MILALVALRTEGCRISFFEKEPGLRVVTDIFPHLQTLIQLPIFFGEFVDGRL